MPHLKMGVVDLVEVLVALVELIFQTFLRISLEISEEAEDLEIENLIIEDQI